MVPPITDCIFWVGPKRKGRRPVWCRYLDISKRELACGYSGTSLELAYRDFRRQWKAKYKV